MAPDAARRLAQAQLRADHPHAGLADRGHQLVLQLLALGAGLGIACGDYHQGPHTRRGAVVNNGRHGRARGTRAGMR